VRWSTADPGRVEALSEDQALIRAEALAVDFGPTGDVVSAGDVAVADADADASQSHRHESPELGLTFWLEAR
jgi:hypothetical protein